MARTYAGILGLLAFLTSLVRGLYHAQGPESLMGQACVHLAVFAIAGWAIGGCARWIVEDSVRQRLEVEIAAQEGRASAPPKAAT